MKQLNITRETIVTIVGSRKAPRDACDLLRRFAYQVARRRAVTRTGDAIGADDAAYTGVRQLILVEGIEGDEATRLARVYMAADISRHSYGGIQHTHMDNRSFYHCISGPRLPRWRSARLIAADIHPVWDKLDQMSKSLHARNIFQDLGDNLDSPSDLLVFWAEPESGQFVAGGTNTAVQCAIEHGIPRINLWHHSVMVEFEAWVVSLETNEVILQR